MVALNAEVVECFLMAVVLVILNLVVALKAEVVVLDVLLLAFVSIPAAVVVSMLMDLDVVMLIRTSPI
jgi:hypothetical protein